MERGYIVESGMLTVFGEFSTNQITSLTEPVTTKDAATKISGSSQTSHHRYSVTVLMTIIMPYLYTTMLAQAEFSSWVGRSHRERSSVLVVVTGINTMYGVTKPHSQFSLTVFITTPPDLAYINFRSGITKPSFACPMAFSLFELDL